MRISVMAAQTFNGLGRVGASKTRRALAAALIALSFAAMLVHGRASRPVQPQFARIGETIEAFDDPPVS